jgi:hypothetical protein
MREMLGHSELWREGGTNLLAEAQVREAWTNGWVWVWVWALWRRMFIDLSMRFMISQCLFCMSNSHAPD